MGRLVFVVQADGLDAVFPQAFGHTAGFEDRGHHQVWTNALGQQVTEIFHQERQAAVVRRGLAHRHSNPFERGETASFQGRHGQDLRLPGLLFQFLRRPHVGAEVGSFLVQTFHRI